MDDKYGYPIALTHDPERDPAARHMYEAVVRKRINAIAGN
jgi:hypothetical protein